MASHSTPPISKQDLKKIRLKAGLSLYELGKKLGTHPANLSYWETSGRPPKSDLLVPMAKILGVSVEELLGVKRTVTKKKAPPLKAKSRKRT